MLSLFPQLLFLSALSATLLRVVAGAYLLFLAYRIFVTRRESSTVTRPIIGNPPSWILLIAAGITAIIAVLLITGFWTQAAAIVGTLISLKLLVLPRRFLFPIASDFPRSTAVLLLVICISLIVTGAGAFAFDLPL